jgi:hypothetical protein
VLADVPTPTVDVVLALLRQRAAQQSRAAVNPDNPAKNVTQANRAQAQENKREWAQ